MSTSSLWLERSRLDGMVLSGVSQGVYLLLTIQSLVALTRRPRQGGKIADNRLILICYIVITFILGTVCFAANARYTQMIWIDLRDVPGGPLGLIENEMVYRINVLAICSAHVQEWFMQALLLHRCFVVWNRQIYVVILMISLYIAMIALSIFIQVEASKGIAFYNIGPELAYLCISVGFNVIYTVLVVHRLLVMRRDMKRVLAQYDCSTYDDIVVMVVESAAIYSIFTIVFIVAFALHNNGITTICFLSFGQLQGIAQLLIIIRVATGRAVTHEMSTRMAGPPTTVEFSGGASGITEESDDQPMPRLGRDIVHTYSTSKKAAEAGVCIA